MIEREFATKYLIFKCIAGSHSYGTALPESDMDTRGVFIAPPDYILSCTKSIEQVEDAKQDEVIYELRKFLKLAANNNPNILELLFSDEENILEIDWPFQKIRDNRHLFLSKKAKFTFSGYGAAQLKRIKGHNKWIARPQPKEPPTLAQYCRFVGLGGTVERDPDRLRELQRECFLVETFGYTQFRVFRSPEFFKEKLGFFNKDETQPKFVNVSDEVLTKRAEFVGFLWINLDEFKSRHREWKQYWEWKNNRNPVRAAMEEQWGFDCKHALHLVRLMSMAEEILTEGKVIVRRPDAQHLLDIRQGKFDYGWLLKWSEEMDAKLDDLYEKSTLPHSADLVAIDNLYREIVVQYWKEKGLWA